MEQLDGVSISSASVTNNLATEAEWDHMNYSELLAQKSIILDYIETFQRKQNKQALRVYFNALDKLENSISKLF